MKDESYLDYENAGPKMVGVYKFKSGVNTIISERNSFKKSSYLPIELLHWAGMSQEYAYVVEDILTKYPDYINKKTVSGENVAFIAAANENVEVLKIIYKMFPEALNLKTDNGNIIQLALKEQAYDSLKYLLSLEDIEFNDKAKNGMTITHFACLYGNSDILEVLDSKNLTEFMAKDLTYGRTPIYFIIDDYLAHQNNWLFEMTLQKYTKTQLMEKDSLELTVLDYLREKMANQPSIVKRVYSPLLFSLSSMLGIEEND